MTGDWEAVGFIHYWRSPNTEKKKFYHSFTCPSSHPQSRTFKCSSIYSAINLLASMWNSRQHNHLTSVKPIPHKCIEFGSGNQVQDLVSVSKHDVMELHSWRWALILSKPRENHGNVFPDPGAHNENAVRPPLPGLCEFYISAMDATISSESGEWLKIIWSWRRTLVLLQSILRGKHLMNLFILNLLTLLSWLVPMTSVTFCLVQKLNESPVNWGFMN